MEHFHNKNNICRKFEILIEIANDSKGSKESSSMFGGYLLYQIKFGIGKKLELKESEVSEIIKIKIEAKRETLGMRILEFINNKFTKYTKLYPDLV